MFNEEQLSILQHKINNNESIQSMANYFGINRDTLRRIIKENNLYDYENNTSYRKIKGNYNFFENIDTEEKAYWLGFLAADGTVWKDKNGKRSSVCININSKDREHLEKFLKSTGIDSKIYDNLVSTGYSNESCMSRINIYSNKMADDLISHGVVQNKSLILEPPVGVPDNLIQHFIRGYFDGDGTINKNTTNNSYNFGMLGTHGMIEWIINWLELDTTIKKDKRTEDRNCYYFQIAGTNKVYHYLTKLYKDSNIYLTRKYDKYLQLKNNVLQ